MKVRPDRRTDSYISRPVGAPADSDVHMKLHEALVVFVDPFRWRSWFKEKGSRNGNSVCFQPFVDQRAPSRGVNKYS